MNLLEGTLCGVQRLSDSTIFYFGAAPNDLHTLPAEAEFTMVYSPVNENGWESVRYSVIPDHKGYAVLERRLLRGDEIHHFEHLLQSL